MAPRPSWVYFRWRGISVSDGGIEFRRTKRSAGFTLIEVIVAIAILSVTFSALLEAISNGLRQTAQAEKMAVAGSLAQSLLAEAGVNIPLIDGQRAGQFPNGFRWRLTTHAFGDEADRQLWPTGAYQLLAEVSWDEGTRERSYALATVRLGPKEQRR